MTDTTDLNEWQALVDSGEAWRLEPWFGAMAAELIASGAIHNLHSEQ